MSGTQENQKYQSVQSVIPHGGTENEKVKYIPLTQGKFAIVDAKEWEDEI